MKRSTDDEVFAILERFVADGARCPENGCHGVGHGQIPSLARTGRIRIEISGQNYRRVVLLTGANAGKGTTPDPNGRKPWKIIDSSGTRINQRLATPAGGRRQPSELPRF